MYIFLLNFTVSALLEFLTFCFHYTVNNRISMCDLSLKKFSFKTSGLLLTHYNSFRTSFLRQSTFLISSRFCRMVYLFFFSGRFYWFRALSYNRDVYRIYLVSTTFFKEGDFYCATFFSCVLVYFYVQGPFVCMCFYLKE